MRLTLFILALVLAAPPASAGWRQCPGDTADTNTAVQTPFKGQSLCYRYTGTTDPSKISLRRCFVADVHVDSDITQVATVTDATVQLYRCPDATTAGIAHCEKILVDTDADGVKNDTTLNGDATSNRDAIYDIPGGTFIAVDVIADPAGTAEVMVTCR